MINTFVSNLETSTVLVFNIFFLFSKKLPIVVVRDVCPSVRQSVCPSVRLSVCPSVRLSSVEIISFRGILISNRPIDLKIGLCCEVSIWSTSVSVPYSSVTQ